MGFVAQEKLSSGRVGAAIARLADGRVLVAGGAGAGRTLPAEIFDPSSRRWARTAAPLAGAGLQAHTLPDGTVVLAGGRRAEIYDPAMRVWIEIDPPAFERLRHVSVLLPGGRVALVGGESPRERGEPVPVLPIEVLDPVSRRWSVSGTLPDPRLGHAAVTLLDGRVLITGGSPAPRSGFALVWDPRDGSIVPIRAKAERRTGHTSTLLADGRVLLAGGRKPPDGERIAILDVFDPRDGSWTESGRLAIPRTGHTATETDGRVFIAGGESADGPARESECWDPSGEVRPSGALLAARSGHAAIAVGDSVLLAGGSFRSHDGTTVVLDSVESWTPAASERPGAFLPCPACGGLPDGTRAIDSRWQSASAGRGGTWEFRVACPQCLSVLFYVWHEVGRRFDPPAVEATGSVVLRLRDGLAAAAADGRLAAEVMRLVGDPAKSFLLAVPEVWREAREGLGSEARLAANAMLIPAGRDAPPPPAPMEKVPPAWALERTPGHFSPDLASRAVHGGKPGGFLFPTAVPIADQTTPVRVLAETRLAIRGMHGDRLILALPAHVADKLPLVETVSAPVGLVFPKPDLA